MRAGLRTVLLFAFCAAHASAWVESVEFPWNSFPRHLWERELVWLKNIGIRHVSLPAGHDAGQLDEVIRIVRRLGLEADLEGAVPDRLIQQTTAHGGPLTPPLPPTAARISALAPDALMHSRRLLTSGVPAVIWTDVEETFNATGFHAGAVNFAGDETAATVPLRRNAQLARYWGDTLSSLKETPVALAIPGISAKMFSSLRGASFVAVMNSSPKTWTGDLKLKRVTIPNVTVGAHNTAWLPVNVPLTAGPLCRDCTAFASTNRVVYANAEMTAMEYENGILAIEFSAPARGEVVLQLTKEPAGPFVAGGKPTGIDWDEKTQTVRLPVPKGSGAGNHVRVGLAIEAPDATAFFTSARVLLIGETNHLTAEFSSDAISQRSRLRITPEFPYTQDPAKEPLQYVYNIKVPESAVHGDHADLSIEADGSRMSHARPQILRAATLRFGDMIGVRVSANSLLSLSPAIVPVNQKGGRELSVTIRNNAPEIRNFRLEIKADAMEFSPSVLDVTVGASASREVSFRVFATGAAPGLHVGEAKLSGGANVSEPVSFAVIPGTGAVAYSAGNLFFLESAKIRAILMPGRFLELLNKDNNQNALPSGGLVVAPGPIEAMQGSLAIGQKAYQLADLEQLVPKPKK